jgi:hypothetical protein
VPHDSDTLARLSGIEPTDPDRTQILIALTDAFRRGDDLADPEVIARCVIEGRYLAHRERKHQAEGIVYYLMVGSLVKIGTTRNLTARLFGYPPDAELLATEQGGAERERQRHEQFAHLRAARAEWFRPEPELLAHCATLRTR